MKKLLTILAISTLAHLHISTLMSQPALTWAKQMGGTDYDQGSSIAVDSSGNVYTIGKFAGTADFDPGVGTFNMTSAGFTDIFVSKLDLLGNFVWAKQLGGTDYDGGSSIAVDGSGNVYTTGSFQGTVDFDPGASIFTLTSAGVGDIFVSKLDLLGNFVWAKQMGGAGSDGGIFIALDGSGNVYIIGTFEGTADFDPGASIFTLTSAGATDIFVSKLDLLGNFVWAKQMGGIAFDYGYSIAVDDSGNVYTTGHFQSTADFDPGASIFNMTSAGGFDIFVSKLDLLGNFVWAKQMGGTAWDKGHSIAVDPELLGGNVYTTGYFTGTVDFDPGASIFTLTSAGIYDIFVSKLNASGNFVWAIRMGGASWDYGISIALDGSANVYVMGDQYSGTVDFDPSAGAYNVSNTGTEASFIAQYDNSGNFLCAFAITPGHNEISGKHSLAVAGSNIYITARFDTAGTDFDPCPPVYNLPHSGGVYDIYVAKYDMSNCNCVPPPPPVADFTASDTMICEDSCISFTDLSTNTPTSWQWSFPGGIPLISISQNPANICYNTAGIYDVQLIATNAGGSDTLIKTAYIQVDTCPLLPPAANFIASDTMICEGDCINFTDLSTDTPTSWQWSFPGGIPSSSSTQNPANICYDTAGTYDVTLIATNAFGSDTLLKTNYIQVDTCPPPAANFTASDTMICEDSCINFTDLSTDTPTSWQWLFPGAVPSTSIAQNPTNICYNDTGVFDVQLIATNANGSDTLTIDPYIVIENCENIFFIPNSFSPNGDGLNDVLFIRGSGIKNIKLFIYNRWGEKVFQCSMFNVQCSEGWNGTYKGKPLNTAVFAWYVEVEFLDGDKIYRKGNVTLLR